MVDNKINEIPIFISIKSYLFFIYKYYIRKYDLYILFCGKTCKGVSFDGASTSAKASDVSIY